tara:strand:+ start:851 stop:1129 length:279 start_codon:yes stop_codon:yes gene_type:complete
VKITPIKLKKIKMEKIYEINISKNKNSTSYFIACSELRINVTVHHHDFLSYMKELRKSLRATLRDCQYKVMFSSYRDCVGDIRRNSFTMTNK